VCDEQKGLHLSHMEFEFRMVHFPLVNIAGGSYLLAAPVKVVNRKFQGTYLEASFDLAGLIPPSSSLPETHTISKSPMPKVTATVMALDGS
jgi:hypothetical protein